MKYKVQTVANDLSIDKSELLRILDEVFPVKTPRKAASTIGADEVGYLLEKFTRDNEVKDLAAAFAQTKSIKTPKPETADKKETKKKPAKKAETVEEQPAEAPVEKAPEEKEKAQPAAMAAEKAPEPAPEDKKPAEEPKPAVNSEIKNRDNRNNRSDKNVAANRENRDGFKQNNRQQSGAPKPAGNQQKQLSNNSQERKPQPTGKQGVKPPVKQPVSKPAIDSSKIKVNTPPVQQKQKGEAVKHGEQVTKKVDTRGSYVELDKYNERYETMAGGRGDKMNSDNFRSKQKFTQKSQQRGKQQYSSKRETEAQKLRRLELERARKQQLKVQIPDEIVVGELATRLKVTASEVIKKLFGLGVMANINETIDFDTASLIAEELGARVEKEIVVTIEERLFEDIEDKDEDLQPRSPVVVVMGHVDHGKTSILDYIRNAHVTSTEAGGITQHIGAYRVHLKDRDITFLDTPGHEAFTAMRARGAMITDIAILVVAADDGIMPQTVEAINHAKAAGVQIIVAINKMDKEGANPDRIKEELTKYDLVCEDWGGNIICVPVSAKTGEGMDNLLEMVGLTADVMELKANPDRLAKGAVIEARLDKSRGPIATLLVQNGTLHTGDIIIAGMAVGRVRVMRDDTGRSVSEAGPSIPVEIMGLSEVPSAGDTFAAVEDEKLARELVEKRKTEAKEEQFSAYKKVTLDNLFSSIEQGDIKELPIIVKADVQGSVEAVRQSLEKISSDEVNVRVIHGGVGAVNESDVKLADASNAIIVGFNVRPNPAAEEVAKENGVEIRLYRVIYDAIEDITTAMKGMLAPKFREVALGKAEVRQVYKISSVGIVAGSYVLDGKILRSSQIRIVRDGIIVGDDKIAGLQRFKDAVKEVSSGFECGISLEKFTDIKEGDIFEAYVMEEYRE
ncbi:MAG: translation initiation factor IF-2 [Oscillospiraceae bacterium]|nr:translation initiation factor IF-2 [Oscillospiraceae bacterium]